MQYTVLDGHCGIPLQRLSRSHIINLTLEMRKLWLRMVNQIIQKSQKICDSLEYKSKYEWVHTKLPFLSLY